MPLSTLISSFFQNMEAAKVSAVCLSMKRYRRRKNYQRLKRMLSNTQHEDDNENEMISMLEECRRRNGGGMVKTKVKASSKIIGLPPPAVEPLRKWRDAYVEMMLCLAGHVAQLNSGNVYLFKRIPKANLVAIVSEDHH